MSTEVFEADRLRGLVHFLLTRWIEWGIVPSEEVSLRGEREVPDILQQGPGCRQARGVDRRRFRASGVDRRGPVALASWQDMCVRLSCVRAFQDFPPDAVQRFRVG